MRIHKRLIDLHSPSEVVKKIVSFFDCVCSFSLLFLHLLSISFILDSTYTAIAIEPGVEVEVAIAKVKSSKETPAATAGAPATAPAPATSK